MVQRFLSEPSTSFRAEGPWNRARKYLAQYLRGRTVAACTSWSAIVFSALLLWRSSSDLLCKKRAASNSVVLADLRASRAVQPSLADAKVSNSCRRRD